MEKRQHYKDYEIFNNGSGWYYDYFYDTGVLKEKGFYKNNKKHRSWVLFDEKEKEI